METTNQLSEDKYHWTRGFARALAAVHEIGSSSAVPNFCDVWVCRVAREAGVTLADVKRAGAPRTDVVVLQEAGLR